MSPDPFTTVILPQTGLTAGEYLLAKCALPGAAPPNYAELALLLAKAQVSVDPARIERYVGAVRGVQDAGEEARSGRSPQCAEDTGEESPSTADFSAHCGHSRSSDSMRGMRGDAHLPIPDDWSDRDDPDGGFDTAVAAERLRQELADERRAETTRLRKIARDERIGDYIRAIAPRLALPPAPPLSPPRDDRPQRAMVVVLSDLHYGKETPSFSPAVAEERLAALARAVTVAVDKERHEASVDECHLLLLGDLVDGQLIYPSHPHHTRTALVDQVFGLAPALAAFVRTLAATFPQVHITGRYGNHGRLSKFHAEHDNGDCYVMRALEGMLAENPSVTWHACDEAEVMGYDVLDTRLLLFHGHQVGGGKKPFNSVLGKVGDWFVALRSERLFHAAVLGHWHQPAHLSLSDIDVVINGAVVSDDDYARNRIAATNGPSQTLLVVEAGRPGIVGRTVVPLA